MKLRVYTQMLGNNLVVALCSVNLVNKISALLTDTSSFSVNFCSTLAPFTSLLDTHRWYLLSIVLLIINRVPDMTSTVSESFFPFLKTKTKEIVTVNCLR